MQAAIFSARGRTFFSLWHCFFGLFVCPSLRALSSPVRPRLRHLLPHSSLLACGSSVAPPLVSSDASRSLLVRCGSVSLSSPPPLLRPLR